MPGVGIRADAIAGTAHTADEGCTDAPAPRQEFLWFWLGVVLVSATLVTVVKVTDSRAEYDRRWREKYVTRVDLWAHQEVRVLRTKGAASLGDYAASFQTDPGMLNYLFEDGANEVLGRSPEKAVLQPWRRYSRRRTVHST